MALSAEDTEPEIDEVWNTLSVQAAEPCTDTGQQVALHVSLAAHRVFIAVMATNAEGTEPDIVVLRRFLFIQAAGTCTDTDERVPFVVDWAAHSHSIAVMVLSSEGINPDNRGDRCTSREVSDCIDDGNVPASPFCLKSLHATLMPSC